MSDDIVKEARRRRQERGDHRILRKMRDEQTTSAVGCVCPPTSERTCKNPKCPRQDHRSLGQKMKDANK